MEYTMIIIQMLVQLFFYIIVGLFGVYKGIQMVKKRTSLLKEKIIKQEEMIKNYIKLCNEYKKILDGNGINI